MDHAEEDRSCRGTELNRRRFFKLGLLGIAALVTPVSTRAALLHRVERERRLAFYNIHTGEHLKTVYWAGGTYLSEGLAQINHILRDFRTDTVVPMHHRLLDLLYLLQTRIELRRPFDVISGYRTPATNALLRGHSRQVAKHSLHMDAMAIDIHAPGVALTRLRDAALSLRLGGVGYYPRSGFVHVDVGRVRHWRGS